MLFNSTEFLFGFLPVVLAVFYLFARLRLISVAKIFLVAASLVFYGWFTPWIISVLVCSLLATYAAVRFIQCASQGSVGQRMAFAFGLAASLGNLIVWKYLDFTIGGFNLLTGADLPLAQLVMPLGISFYTFHQVIFVLDAYAGRVHKQVRLLDYALYVVFFPQLVVGPITRYDELLPQIEAPSFGRLRLQNLLIGGAIFTVGLAKKVIFADNLALMVDPTFDRVGAGFAVSAVEAWRGALAYTLQLYFDFSGYSDMAIGIARAFGMRLPINFHSPLICRSTLDFWRRWHITLTRMTTTYVFSPISMMATRFATKHGIRGLSGMLIMVAPACLVTFVLIGLWHGASDTFLLFGLVHTAYAVGDYTWRHLRLANRLSFISKDIQIFSARVIALSLVVASLALFRAPDVVVFWRYASYMGGSSTFGTLADIDYSFFNMMLLGTALAISQFAPNTQQIFARYRPGIHSYAEHARDLVLPLRRLTLWMGVGLGFAFVVALTYMAHGRAEFLYFGF
jgi:D-alanyl-lipoteichoic acid acyltransferase DltB (MBOAT superfamily)